MAENGDFADGFEAGRRQALELMEDVRQEIVSLAVEVMNTPSGYFPDTIGLGCPHVPGLLGDPLHHLVLDSCALQLSAAERFIRIAGGHIDQMQPGSAGSLDALIATLPRRAAAG